MSGDPAWGANSLLLRGEGAEGGTTIVDSSMYANSLSIGGGAHISTAQYKYGGASLRFGGTDYLYCAAPQGGRFDLSSGDWTAEAWARLDDLSTLQSIFKIHNGIALTENFQMALMVNSGGAARADWFNGGTQYTITAGNFTVVTWAHIAAVKFGTQFRVYLNGVGGTAVTVPSTGNALSGAVAVVGGDIGRTSYNIRGYIDELRITKGVARYTANFTPPIAAHPGPPDDWIVGGRGIASSIRSVSAPHLYSSARPIRPSYTRADGSPGPGSLVGTVKVDTLPVSRKVRLFDVASGRLLKETWSDKAGVYRFDGLALDRPYTVLSHDHQRDYNATVADYVYAEVLP